MVDELLSASEMQRVDAAAMASGIDGYALMCAAGQAVYREAQETLAAVGGTRVAVVAGAGNNGGDGYVVARLLAEVGVAVTVLRIAPPRSGSDATRAADAWTGATLDVGVDNTTWPAVQRCLGEAHLIVDALLGAGLARAPEGTLARLIEAVNASASAVLSVDLPSGLDGESGTVPGAVVRADTSVTFVRLKPAHLLYPGRELCGRVVLDGIGMPTRAVAEVLAAGGPRCDVNAPRLWRDALSLPSGDTHKYRRGHVLVRGGGAASGGAARLAANAVLACGAGAVTLVCAGSATLVNANHLDAVMLARADDADDYAALLDDARISTLLLGPGNGRDAATREAVEVALASGLGCVLDADALTAQGEDRKGLLERLRAADGETILTPHAGEFERLFGSEDAAASKLHRARRASREAGAVVVFKGADTVVAAPDGRAAIARNAPPWLATAGAGDVLAGVAASLLAQGAPAFEAAAAAAWLHGEAACRIGYPLTAEALGPAAAGALGDAVAVRLAR